MFISDFVQMETEFLEIHKEFIISLKKNGIGVDDITSEIASLPENVNYYVYEPLMKATNNIDNTNSFITLFSILKTEVYNFIEYHLLEYLIKKYGSEAMKMRMSKYVDNLKIFQETALVANLLKFWEKRYKKPIFANILDKVQVKFIDKMLTIKTVEQFRNDLLRAFLPNFVEGSIIYYEDIKEGCFIISFLAPPDLVDILENKMNKKDLFDKYQLIYISIHKRRSESTISDNPEFAMEYSGRSSIKNCIKHTALKIIWSDFLYNSGKYLYYFRMSCLPNIFQF